ncbi:hypothetical protein F5882DRAFT_523756 [Hyaloscypha sp. PMI_1271]|nr:hypothetical protein F5882DRAFT_523756 [Hyaloscypha sp. PMI_1271]
MKFSILAFGAVLVALVSGLAIPNPEAAVEERGIYSVGRQPVCEEDVATEDGEYRLPSCSSLAPKFNTSSRNPERDMIGP